MLPPSTAPVASSSMLIVPSGECLSERLTEKQNLGSHWSAGGSTLMFVVIMILTRLIIVIRTSIYSSNIL